ncbi:MAG TPA: PD-(D/E)XK nuclease family protein [Steroidobacteraceae bacterium]
MIRLTAELNEVLKQGGTVVVPSRQRAHAARLAYAAAELGRGHRVWTTPAILPVEAWLTKEVERLAASREGSELPRLLSPAEEWFLWRQCAADATTDLELVNRGALAEALRRASGIAAEFGIDVRKFGRQSRATETASSGATTQLVASDVDTEGATAQLELPDAPDGAPSNSPTFPDEPGTEVALLAEVQLAVDERCRALGAATATSLLPQLRWPVGEPDALGGVGSPAVASGFLKVPPRLQSLVIPARNVPVDELVVPTVVIATDELDELERIAEWCKAQVRRDPKARVLISLPGAPGTRERLATLIRQAIDPSPWFDAKASNSDSLVVIEGGAPLGQMPAVAHALATLSWLSGSAGDFEAVSGWLRSPYWRAPDAVPRARLDLWLRERERMQFNLRDLVGAFSAVPSALAPAAREISAQVNKAAMLLGQGGASPREWSERFRAALEVFGWPGERARDSDEQQTVVRFHELLDEFGQLASAARSISRGNAIQWFNELASRTAFRPADDDAVFTIASVLAAPVVRYDAIWIAGLHAEAFPQPVQPDPFLPLAAQIAAGVPAATANGRLEEAQALLSAWRGSADALVLSAPARAEDLELLPSPLLSQWLAPPEAAEGTVWLPMRLRREGLVESVEDSVGVVWPTEKPLPSGTRSLELQNQCPFRAYAELRLGSTPLDAPEPGVAADLRGQLLHAALQKLWARLRDSEGLAGCPDSTLEALIHRCVEEAANETQRTAPSHRTRPSPVSDAQGDLFGNPQYSPSLTRECRRAERLIRTLCALERERAPFRVQSTELDSTLTLQGAHLRVRIDRVDALETGGRAILDYKSGRRATADWYGDRPSHPQLLAYLAALGDDVVAMATVNVTAREVRFDGIASTPQLLPKVRGVEGELGTDPNDAWPMRRARWIALVEQLAAAFVAGRAAVDPKPGACDYCHVASVCRISDRAVAASTDEPLSGAQDE